MKANLILTTVYQASNDSDCEFLQVRNIFLPSLQSYFPFVQSRIRLRLARLLPKGEQVQLQLTQHSILYSANPKDISQF